MILRRLLPTLAAVAVTFAAASAPAAEPSTKSPAGFYHFAFEAGSPAALAEKRDELRAKGVEVTDIVDHGWAPSIYFRDPNGLSLEYCCTVRNLTEDDATMQERFTIPRGALELNKALSARVLAAQSTGSTRKA